MPAAVGGGLIEAKYSDAVGTSVDAWFHNTDWLPTILHFADATTKQTQTALKDGIDGIDMFDVLINGESNPRTSLVLNMDYVESRGKMTDVALLHKGYKLIWNHQTPPANDSTVKNISKKKHSLINS